MDYSNIATLGIAFGLGLLVGLQRESTNDKIAGVRTFTLISVLGALAGFLTILYENPFILPILGLAITGMLIMANVVKLKKYDGADAGQTTEVAALLMFSIGAYLVLGNQVIGAMIGAVLAILLYAKEHMHDFIDNLSHKDFVAIFTLVGISLVILPILPDKTFGPFDVLNPRNIWLMVTLIVGISVIGYFIYKFLGKKVGIISNGILGGMVSSTATTVSYARKTADTKEISKIAAFVITTASAISMVRVLIEVGIVVPNKLGAIAVPIIAVLLVMLAVCVSLFYLVNKDTTQDDMPEPKNPAQLKSALIFGFLYGFILLAVAFAKEEFGNNALYIVSIISGLTDVDAITLSLSELMREGSLQANVGWKLILLASLSNLVFKGIMAIVMGSKELGKWVSITFGITLIAGLLILWLWPEAWHL